MTLSHWLIYDFAAAIFRRRVYTLRQRCNRSFCRCDVLHKFKPVWIRATHHSDKSLSQRHRLSQECTISHEATCRSNLSPLRVAATCRLVCPNLNTSQRILSILHFFNSQNKNQNCVNLVEGLLISWCVVDLATFSASFLSQNSWVMAHCQDNWSGQQC